METHEEEQYTPVQIPARDSSCSILSRPNYILAIRSDAANNVSRRRFKMYFSQLFLISFGTFYRKAVVTQVSIFVPRVILVPISIIRPICSSNSRDCLESIPCWFRTARMSSMTLSSVSERRYGDGNTVSGILARGACLRSSANDV